MKRTTKEVVYKNEMEKMAKYAKALAHPTRIKILNYLDKQSCCFTGDIVDIFPLAQSTISQHLKELKIAGLIQGELEPPKIKYCINEKNWIEAQVLFCDFFNKNH